LGLVEDSCPNAEAPEEIAAFFLGFLVGVTCHRKNALSRYGHVSRQSKKVNIVHVNYLLYGADNAPLLLGNFFLGREGQSRYRLIA
jgi:hypothetical protein